MTFSPNAPELSCKKIATFDYVGKSSKEIVGDARTVEYRANCKFTIFNFGVVLAMTLKRIL